MNWPNAIPVEVSQVTTSVVLSLSEESSRRDCFRLLVADRRLLGVGIGVDSVPARVAGGRASEPAELPRRKGQPPWFSGQTPKSEARDDAYTLGGLTGYF